ncbi:hypothetical protein [Synechococcus sp. C9]|nr:hypothetical protein [Synechococcus sp. C9]
MGLIVTNLGKREPYGTREVILREGTSINAKLAVAGAPPPSLVLEHFCL